MPKPAKRRMMAAGIFVAAEALSGSGCTVPAASRLVAPAAPAGVRLPAVTTDAQLAGLASAMGGPGTSMLVAAPGVCGPEAAPVVHVVLPEQVLFATASDQPGPEATATLEDIVGKIIQQAPDAALTVLGHTDAVGSDAYNMDLSKRRALTVLRGLAMRGLDPNRLSAVAIGKRQPIASDATADGRARNRRVEFLFSRCLAANLGVVSAAPRDRALLAANAEAGRPVEVMRLDPSGGGGLATLAALSLRPLQGNGSPAAMAPTASPARQAAEAPPAAVARPPPAPHYQPKPLSPDVQPNALGPSVPF